MEQEEEEPSPKIHAMLVNVRYLHRSLGAAERGTSSESICSLPDSCHLVPQILRPPDKEWLTQDSAGLAKGLP